MSIHESLVQSPITERLSHFLDVETARYRLITANLANIDTPGYRARDLDFPSELRRAMTASPFGGLLQSAGFEPVARQVRGLIERPDGNNVSVERESLLLAETQMKFNAGIQLLKDQFHQISLAINSGGSTS